MVVEQVRVEQDDQIQVDHFQNVDQDMDVKVVVDLVDVCEVVVEVEVETHEVLEEPERSRDLLFYQIAIDKDQDVVRSCCCCRARRCSTCC